MFLLKHAERRLSSEKAATPPAAAPARTRGRDGGPARDRDGGPRRGTINGGIGKKGGSRKAPIAIACQWPCPRPEGWVADLGRGTRGTESKQATCQGPLAPCPRNAIARAADPARPDPPATRRAADGGPAARSGDPRPPPPGPRPAGPPARRPAARSGDPRPTCKRLSVGVQAGPVPAGQQARPLLLFHVRCFTASSVPAAEAARPMGAFGHACRNGPSLPWNIGPRMLAPTICQRAVKPPWNRPSGPVPLARALLRGRAPRARGRRVV